MRRNCRCRCRPIPTPTPARTQNPDPQQARKHAPVGLETDTVWDAREEPAESVLVLGPEAGGGEGASSSLSFSMAPPTSPASASSFRMLPAVCICQPVA